MKRTILLVASCAIALLCGVPAGEAAESSTALIFQAARATAGRPVELRRAATETVTDLMRRQATALPGRSPAETEREQELRQPDRGQAAQNPAAPRVARFPYGSSLEGSRPDEPVAPAAATSWPIGLSFMGATLYGVNSTSTFPPDCMGAVGPSQYVVLVNGRLVSFDKATGSADGVLNLTPNVFFAAIRNGFATTDPRIRYDRLSGRWFLTMMNISTPTRILIAVSDAASAGVIRPATAFTFFYIPHDSIPPAIPSSCYADFPTLGIDAHALYIGTNNSCGSATDGFVVRKNSILGAGPMVVTVFRGLAVAGAGGLFTPQGVDNDDPAATDGYFIGTDIAHSGQLDLRRVGDPGGVPAISDNLVVTVPATAQPLRVPHLGNAKGTNGYLDGIDDRLTSACLRRGRLWTCHNIGVDNTGVATGTATRNGSRWYELDLPAGGTPALLQAGTVFAATPTNGIDQRHYWIPSIMVSGQGHAAMGYSAAGAQEHINAGTAVRLAGDPPGTMQTPTLFTNSMSGYNPSANPGGPYGRRWGDYSHTCLDPIDDQTLWTLQQYCDTTGSYGVRVVRLTAPPPATPSTVPDVPAGGAPLTVSLAGATSSGSGFYDPGADLPGVPAFRHLVAQVTNAGATGTPPAVISATCVDPTTVSLTLDPSSATPNLPGEAYTVTVTNPDGQAASAAVLHVVPSPLAVPGGPVAKLALAPVSPTPSVGEARIEFQLPAAAAIRLAVFDLAGREVAVLASGSWAPGRYRAAWSGATARGGGAPAGIYFVRLEAAGRTIVRRLVLAR